MTKTEKLLRELVALPSVNPAFLPEGDASAGERNVAEFLGATAAQSLLGEDFRVLRDRGTFHPTELGVTAMATVHPSAILRARDEARAAARGDFVADLRTAAAWRPAAG